MSFRKFNSEVTVQWSICVCKLLVIGFIVFLGKRRYNSHWSKKVNQSEAKINGPFQRRKKEICNLFL